MQTEASHELATLGAGCFWCVEAVFERLPGVRSVTSGYSGGGISAPTYEQVCSGGTGHAEVVQVEFDPKQISFEQILDVFWTAHDPTTLNRQGADVGTQYRSAIFPHNETQRLLAEKSRADAAKLFARPIVTTIEPFKKFFPAEDYHQDFYRRNQKHPYCRAVILPKLDKIESRPTA
jgi:peptide-methionine (S)-S-oxide reductase